jgi:hypothetical protein
VRREGRALVAWTCCRHLRTRVGVG